VWRFDAPVRCIASTVLGGGVGTREWVVSATVPLDYAEADPSAHAARIAASLGCTGSGAVLLTGVDVRRALEVADGGAVVWSTTGLDVITLAAAPEGAHERWQPGTINVVAWAPVPLADAALVNLVATVAEAKAQALRGAGIDATGTPSDATVVCCPLGAASGADEHRYGGPRSVWGARVARAAHAAIAQGIACAGALPRRAGAGHDREPPDQVVGR
jgi:adenosylcobinamide amidohydrolase